MRKLTVGVIFLICILMASVAVATNDGPNLVATYGETTYANQQLLDSVNDYFASKGYSNIAGIDKEVINASQVNNVSKGISGKTYTSSQIFSSALVDLTQGDSLKVTVDTSKINLVTAKMYASALESAGIEKGQIYVTSPVSATGESALAGIMACYEKATNVEIPQEVKQAANEEIYIQADIVNSTNLTADEVSKLIEDVKNQSIAKNIKSQDDILDLVNETLEKYDLVLSDDDIEKLAEAIYNIMSVQDKVNQYQNELKKVL